MPEKHPLRQFSVKVGTIFEDSPIPLKSCCWPSGRSRIARRDFELRAGPRDRRHAEDCVVHDHRIRLAMQDEDGGGKLGGEVEVDEPSSVARPAI